MKGPDEPLSLDVDVKVVEQVEACMMRNSLDELLLLDNDVTC